MCCFRVAFPCSSMLMVCCFLLHNSWSWLPVLKLLPWQTRLIIWLWCGVVFCLVGPSSTWLGMDCDYWIKCVCARTYSITYTHSVALTHTHTVHSSTAITRCSAVHCFTYLNKIFAVGLTTWNTLFQLFYFDVCTVFAHTAARSSIRAHYTHRPSSFHIYVNDINTSGFRELGYSSMFFLYFIVAVAVFLDRFYSLFVSSHLCLFFFLLRAPSFHIKSILSHRSMILHFSFSVHVFYTVRASVDLLF